MCLEVIRKVLFGSQMEQRLVALYTNERDLDKFAVGYVKAIDETAFTLACISPHGGPDGTYVAPLSAVLRIELDSRYLRRIALLMANRRRFVDRGIARPTGSRGGLLRELQAARRYHHVVGVTLRSSGNCKPDDICGFVRKVDKAHVELLAVTEEGEADGISVVPLEGIERLTRGDEESRCTSIFYEHRGTLYGGCGERASLTGMKRESRGKRRV